MIFAIVMTQKPLLSTVHKEGAKAYQSAREHHLESTRKRQERKARLAEQQAQEETRARKQAVDVKLEQAAKSESFVQTEIPDFVIAGGPESEPEPTQDIKSAEPPVLQADLSEKKPEAFLHDGMNMPLCRTG